MSRAFESIPPDATVKEAAARMNQLNLSMLPVCEAQRVVGILIEPDLQRKLLALRRDPALVPVREIMATTVVTGRDHEDLREVVPMMRAKEIQVLPVLDASDMLLGVFTLGGPWKRPPSRRKAASRTAK